MNRLLYQLTGGQNRYPEWFLNQGNDTLPDVLQPLVKHDKMLLMTDTYRY